MAFFIFIPERKEFTFIWMKKIFILFCISFFVEKNSIAQNLVLNPSFEDTVGCCCYQSAGWGSFRDSPDYFNVCNSILSVPNNFGGFQNAGSGNAYYGFFSYAVFVPEGREFIGEELTQHLIAGTKYLVNFKVNLSDSSGCATNNIGISFSTVPFNSVNGAPINNHAFVFSQTIITDKLNWEIISGSFIADSNYQYVMIGNFFDDNSIDTSIVSPSFYNGYDYAYYFVDDVSVVEDTSIQEGIYNLKETMASINLYPNPATNQLTVESTKTINTIEITDAIGRVQSFKLKVQRPATQIDIHALASGIYFIKLYFGDGSFVVKKFIKE